VEATEKSNKENENLEASKSNYSMYNDSKAIRRNWMNEINRAKAYLANQSVEDLSADIDPRLIREQAKHQPRHRQEDLVDYVRSLEVKLNMVIDKLNEKPGYSAREPSYLHPAAREPVDIPREPYEGSRELRSFSRLSRSIGEEVGRRLLGYQLAPTPREEEPAEKWADKVPKIPAYVSARELMERRASEEGEHLLPRFDAGKILSKKPTPKLVFDNKTSNIHVYDDY